MTVQKSREAHYLEVTGFFVFSALDRCNSLKFVRKSLYGQSVGSNVVFTSVVARDSGQLQSLRRLQTCSYWLPGIRQIED